MDQPLISVIVPVYKVEKYLDRCLQSITGQTYGNLEILLVDDGSPDHSGAICDAWAARDSRIRVFHQENAGAGAARNRALDTATGELIGFVDSDDYLEPHMYEHLYSLMTEDVDISECGICMTESDDHPMDDGTIFTPQIYSLEEAMALHIRDEKFCQTPPNKLYRRAVVGDIRFPVGMLIDDEFFTYRVIANCRKLARTSCIMYAYRQQPGSAMHKPYSIRRLDSIQAKRERLNFLRQKLPALVYEGELDLFMTCLFSMQGCLSFLEGEELRQAKAILYEALEEVTPLVIRQDLSIKKKVLLWVAQRSFEGVAKILNFLIRIHVLS